MCQTITIGDDWLETIGDVRRVLGRDAVVLLPARNADPLTVKDDECLCWVDMQATADRAGYVAAQDPRDSFEWHFSKPR